MESATMMLELTKSEKLSEEKEPSESFICRIGWHSWVYLDPSEAQLEEVRRLITHGRGSLGLSTYGFADNNVCDRICRLCHKGEPRFLHFLDGLKAARGIKNDDA